METEGQKIENSLNKPICNCSHVILCSPFVLGWWLYFLKEALLHDCQTCSTACLTSFSPPEEWASMDFELCMSLLCCVAGGALQIPLHSTLGRKPLAVCWGCTSALCSSIGQTRQPSAWGAWSPSPQTGLMKAGKKDFLCFLNYEQRGFESASCFLLTWGTAGLLRLVLLFLLFLFL